MRMRLYHGSVNMIEEPEFLPEYKNADVIRGYRADDPFIRTE